MSRPVYVTATRLIAAPASRIYGILADYRTGHPLILPRAFQSLTVEAGGRGAGTVIRFGMRSLGTVKWARATVGEPEPGRVLVERLDDRSVETTFTVDPSGRDSACVTIATSWTPRGRGASLVRLLAPLLLKRIYAEELRNLERVAAQN
jgi:Polyketide cyclase / dehydrase and lipid transport